MQRTNFYVLLVENGLKKKGFSHLQKGINIKQLLYASSFPFLILCIFTLCFIKISKTILMKVATCIVYWTTFSRWNFSLFSRFSLMLLINAMFGPWQRSYSWIKWEKRRSQNIYKLKGLKSETSGWVLYSIKITNVQ